MRVRNSYPGVCVRVCSCCTSPGEKGLEALVTRHALLLAKIAPGAAILAASLCTEKAKNVRPQATPVDIIHDIGVRVSALGLRVSGLGQVTTSCITPAKHTQTRARVSQVRSGLCAHVSCVCACAPIPSSCVHPSFCRCSQDLLRRRPILPPARLSVCLSAYLFVSLSVSVSFNTCSCSVPSLTHLPSKSH